MILISNPIANRILHFLFPSDCVSCGGPLRDHPLVCRKCLEELPVVKQAVCPKCGMPLGPDISTSECEDCRGNTFPFSGLKSLCFYEGVAKKMVHALKFSKRASMGELMARLICESGIDAFDADYILPIPLHPDREKVRGYNQSEMISKAISKRTGIRSLGSVLRRRKKTEAQSLLNREERTANMEGAFVFGPAAKKIRGKHVIILDDVTTTGTTVLEASRMVARLDPASIRIVTWAKAV